HPDTCGASTYLEMCRADSTGWRNTPPDFDKVGFAIGAHGLLRTRAYTRSSILMATPVPARLTAWARLASSRHTVPAGFTTRAGSGGACRVFPSQTQASAGAGLGREALIRRDQGRSTGGRRA